MIYKNKDGFMLYLWSSVIHHITEVSLLCSLVWVPASYIYDSSLKLHWPHRSPQALLSSLNHPAFCHLAYRQAKRNTGTVSQA